MLPLQGAGVRSLVRKLRSHKLHGMAKKKKMACKLYFDKNLEERKKKQKKEEINERKINNKTWPSHRQNGTVILENRQFLKKLNLHLHGSQQSTFWCLS